MFESIADSGSGEASATTPASETSPSYSAMPRTSQFVRERGFRMMMVQLMSCSW